MIQSGDGSRLVDGGGGTPRRPRSCVPPPKFWVSAAIGAVLLFVVDSFDAQAFSGALQAPVSSAVQTVANRAMTFLGEPVFGSGDSTGAAAANRPYRLAAAPPARVGEAQPLALSQGPSGQMVRPVNITNAATAIGSVMGQNQPAGSGRDETLIDSVTVQRSDTGVVRVARNASAVIKLKSAVDGVEIADPSVADVYLTSPTRIVVTGRNFGATQMILRIGDVQQSFHVNVELDLSLLDAFIKQVAPASRVEARSINGTIFLTGTVSDTGAAQQITDMAGLVQGGEVRSNLTIAGVQQTMLRVVVAEVNRAAVRRLGVNWAVGASNFSRDFFFANNLGQLNPSTFANGGVADVTLGQQIFSMLPVANGPTTNITFGFPRAEFQMFLNALRENGLSRTLAEPNLVAISGQTATFLAGGEVPLSVVSSTGGSSTVTIIYREFGVRLGFTPTVLGGQLIRLHVMAEVSEPVPSGATIGGLPVFSFNTRRVETTIECGNGQTFAIAGLLNEKVQALASKIPGLGDIPVLGTLFSSTSYQRDETEMVVLVTPQLVEPLDPHQVPPPPGGLMTHPNDKELFALQQLEGTPRQRPESDRVPREEYPVKTRPSSAAGGWPTSQLALRGPWGMAGYKESAPGRRQ